MKIIISRYEALFYTILRIALGFLFMWHGSQKLFKFPDPGSAIPLYVVLIAGPIEFGGGILTMLGLWTRIAAFLCSGEMAYAYWFVHAGHAALPIVNHGELAVIYCFLFLYIFIKGAGKYSLDHLIYHRKFFDRITHRLPGMH